MVPLTHSVTSPMYGEPGTTPLVLQVLLYIPAENNYLLSSPCPPLPHPGTQTAQAQPRPLLESAVTDPGNGLGALPHLRVET